MLSALTASITVSNTSPSLLNQKKIKVFQTYISEGKFILRYMWELHVENIERGEVRLNSDFRERKVALKFLTGMLILSSRSSLFSRCTAEAELQVDLRPHKHRAACVCM